MAATPGCSAFHQRRLEHQPARDNAVERLQSLDLVGPPGGVGLFNPVRKMDHWTQVCTSKTYKYSMSFAYIYFFSISPL